MARTKKQKELKVITIGKPSIEALSETERKIFYQDLLHIIIRLKQEEDAKNNNEISGEKKE